MKVSVIIPTYNREQYICQAIESVMEQTVGDTEIIVVDDGSTDNTHRKIGSYKERVNYIYTRNGGPAQARNVGLRSASGDYIAFLDSDDLYYPHKIELQTGILEKYSDIGMVYTEFSAFSDMGFWDEYHLRKYHTAYRTEGLRYEDIFHEQKDLKEEGIGNGEWVRGSVYVGNIFDWYLRHIIVFTNSMMLRRSILKTVGFLNERYFLFDDLEFALRICKNVKVGFVDIPTYKLRYHGEQISGIYQDTGLGVTIQKQENLIEIVEKYGVEDKEYYYRHKPMIDRRMAILHKALAIPLLAKGKDAQKARYHIERCAEYGHGERFLRIVSFFPYVLRRILVKIMSIMLKH